MMSLNEWKELVKISFIILATMLIVAYIIALIVARMKNKAQKETRKQITHREVKIDLCDYLMANMKQEYLGQKKVIFNELMKM